MPNERGKGNVWSRFVCRLVLESIGKPSPPKQSVKFECQIWSEIIKTFAKKCLDASSQCLTIKNKCLDVSSRA